MHSINNKGWRPLAGIRVADFSALLPGPLTTAILADLGADVVKIEPPSGDGARHMLPTVFSAVNRNKRGATLDLKDAENQARITEIARWADIVIEGFRPGVARRLGIGFDALAEINPRLVYCSLSGYGQDGPWSDKPGHDLNYLAAGGALAFPGTWGTKPARSSLPIADITAAGWASTAILAALRERDQTNKSVLLDLSLFESTLFCTALRHGLDEDGDPTSHLFPGNDLFETADDQLISLGLLENQFWQAFCVKLGDQAPALHDPRFATIAGRREHGDELTALLRHTMQQHDAHYWHTLLAGSNIPFDVCLSPAQAAKSEHIHARGRVVERDGNKFIPFPVTVNRTQQINVSRCAPTLGEHTSEFMREIGLCNDHNN